MERKLENKALSSKIEVKESEAGDVLHLTCYGLAFGNVDSYGDIILSTACDRWLKSEDAQRVRFCYQHDLHNVVGVIKSMEADSYGLKLEVDVLPTAAGKDLQVLLRAGAVDEFSIGYFTDDCDFDAEGHRLLKEISIVEVSAVSRAANPKAVVVDVKEQGGATTAEEAKDAAAGSETAKEDAQALDLGTMSDDELTALAGNIEQEQYRRVLENL